MVLETDTVSFRLGRIGLTHARDSCSEADGRHTIYRTTTGETVGRMDVFEAIELCARMEPPLSRSVVHNIS